MDSQHSQASASAQHASVFLRVALMALALLGANVAWAQDEEDDPPSRVARMAAISGDVTFATASDEDWNPITLNRPLTTGDRLLTNNNSRAAMDIDGGDLRISENTAFNFLRLDDRGTQIELSRGTLNWRIDVLNQGQNYEVDTPTIAFVATQPGTYKINVSEDGSVTTVSILQGAGTVYGESGTSYPISGRQSWRFSDPSLNDISGMALAQDNSFDRWCVERDARARSDVSTRYVSSDVVGYSDLASNGEWSTVTEYGNVWYPRTVVVGWAPYRYGHWSWVAPWGWTWIDDASWGFAPFHYGRWVYVSNRWGWVPGPRHVRPVYCPAAVAFVGGSGWNVSISSGRPIGWVPLGPRDVYMPWYRGSHRYVTNVNVTNVININRTQITTVYNNSRYNRGQNIRYMNQSAPGGTTAVTRENFSRGRPVRDSHLRIDRDQIDRASSLRRNEMPTDRPQFERPARQFGRTPSQEFSRPVISHREPPRLSLGAREPSRNNAPTWGTVRDTPFNRNDSSREQRDNNRNTPERRENDPRWNRDEPRENNQRPRVETWGNRGESPVREPQKDLSTGQQIPVQEPTRPGNDPRWNRGEQRENIQRQDNNPSSRESPRGNRGNAPAQRPSEQPAQVQPGASGRDDDRRSNWGRNNDATPVPRPQVMPPQVQPAPVERSQDRSSPRFGSPREERVERNVRPMEMPRVAPREQRAAPAPQAPVENGNLVQNRLEAFQQRQEFNRRER